MQNNVVVVVVCCAWKMDAPFPYVTKEIGNGYRGNCQK